MRILLILLLCAAPVSADELRLQDGRVFVGIVHDRPQERFRIRMETGRGKFTFLRSEVLSIRRGRTPLHDYYDREALLKESQDPSAWLSLFDFSQKHKLSRFEKPLMKKVLDLDPDNDRARLFLGYQKFQGQWMSRSQMREAVGMVQVDGVWMTTAERALLTSRKLRADLKKAERELEKNRKRVLRRIAGEYSEKKLSTTSSSGFYYRPSWFWPYYFRPDPVFPGGRRLPVGLYDVSPGIDILPLPRFYLP